MKTKQTQKNYGLFVEGAQLGRTGNQTTAAAAPEAQPLYGALGRMLECDAQEVRELIKERDEARASAEELANALKPFAFAVKEEIPDDAEVWRIGNWNVYGRDVIAARAALAQWEKANQ
jgi:hypothetical protein